MRTVVEAAATNRGKYKGLCKRRTDHLKLVLCAKITWEYQDLKSYDTCPQKPVNVKEKCIINEEENQLSESHEILDTQNTG